MAGDYAQTWPTVQTTPYPVPDKLNNPLEVEVPINGPLPFYLHTSQARHWSLSATQLHDMRVRANALASDTLKQYAKESSAPIPNVLSMDDELAIIRFYLLRVGRLVKAFGLPSLVESTAMTFMKRFYLRNSCMQFHPKLIMCVANKQF